MIIPVHEFSSAPSKLNLNTNNGPFLHVFTFSSNFVFKFSSWLSFKQLFRFYGGHIKHVTTFFTLRSIFFQRIAVALHLGLSPVTLLYLIQK